MECEYENLNFSLIFETDLFVLSKITYQMCKIENALTNKWDLLFQNMVYYFN